MRISEFRIDRYGPLRTPTIEPDGGLEVIFGPNESGKTLLLEALLKFLEPDISDAMPAIERVSERPSGYIVVDTPNGEIKLGDDTTLNEIAPIEPMHLRNIFVIRDNDLRLHNQHQFYDSVTEQIGDLYTSDIEGVQSRLEELGRLTPTTRNVSSAEQYNDAKDVRDTASDLAENIREYVEEARANGFDDLEGERIQVRKEIRRCNRELDIQERAAIAVDHARLSDQLETVEQTTAELNQLEDISRETLEELARVQNNIENTAENRQDVKAQLDTAEDEIKELETTIRKSKNNIQPLENRKHEISQVKDALESFRSKQEQAAGLQRSIGMAQIVTAAGLGFGGIATLGSLILGQGLSLPAIILIFVGLLGVIWYFLKHRALTTVERQEESLLQQARDAGLDVEEVSEIAPAVETFRDQIEAKQNELDELAKDRDLKTSRVDDRREQLEKLNAKSSELKSRKREILQDAGVADIDEYRQRVERKESLQSERAPAEQSLVDQFGDPGVEGMDSKIEFWRDGLREFATGVDIDGVGPSDYDENTHNELQSELQDLEDRDAELQDTLEQHQRKIDDFQDRVRGLSATPFIGEQISLQAKTTEGLTQLAQDLEELASQINRDAEVSRTALEIFDELHEEEEEKITDLFETDGRASQVFQKISDGRYEQVEYDPDRQKLVVYRDTGQTLTADELSRGTREQLYLSARVSLAERLLETEPGFLLLDDALLPADEDRLEEGFKILERLADDGWQILYLTAKAEVGEDIVNKFGLAMRKLEPLP